MDTKRLCGYLRLACDVLKKDFSQLEPSSPRGELFEVTLANRRYSGPLMGCWFERGKAEMGAVAAERFIRAGYAATRIDPGSF